MAGDMEALLKVSASASALMAYARFTAARTSPGPRRLFTLLPAIAPLFFLPLSLSSLHLRGFVGFFLAWLAVFKLLLLSFDAGPLSPSLPFPTFLSIATLPIKIRPVSPSVKPPYLLPTTIKAAILAINISLFSYRDRFPHYLVLAHYSVHTYLALELILSSAALIGCCVVGFDIEPQFNAPYLSTSLHDFWGRRWNLMVPAILRPSVYVPIRAKWGTFAGILATFLVSGVMHELMFYYFAFAQPTGELTCFFLLHGTCTAVEGWLKKAQVSAGYAVRVNPVMEVVLTLGFVAATGFWLFFPPLLRHGFDELVVKETMAFIGAFSGLSQVILDLLRLI